MRTARILGRGASYYHCMSRVIERRNVLDTDEKERFRKIMRKVAEFAGVEILTYAVMSNHFHILLQVPVRKELSEEDVLARIKGLYGGMRAADVAYRLRKLREQGREEEASMLLYGYTHRMYDLSEYMKMVMQRFTQSYNRRHGRRGPLWEDRFKSILVEGRPGALSTMAAYIDLNAVRAELAKDPKGYRFCGYGEAVAGGREARRGVLHICRILGEAGTWDKAAGVYRKHLFVQAEAHTGSGVQVDRKRVKQVLESGGKLTRAELLRCRVRYFSEGVVLGSKAFVEDVYLAHREQFGSRRRSGARRPKHGQWGDLYTMRNLKLNPVSVPSSS